MVDTGSYGLRIFAQPLPTTSAALSTLNLPSQTNANGNQLAECAQFASGVTWGPIKKANLQIGSEVANDMAIQVIADPSYATIPSDCTKKSSKQMQTPKIFGANGVIGIGVFAQDCGNYCAQIADNYFYQTSSGWSATPIPVAQQLQNPVTLFSQDNNGTILAIDTLQTPSSTYVAGTLTFGIDTQINNHSNNTNTIWLDTTYGYLTTQFNGHTYSQSYVDSGSNGYFFTPYPAISALSTCLDSTGFYCPTNTLSYSAMVTSNAVQSGTTTPTSATINFSIDNAQSLYSVSGVAAVKNLAGTGDYTTFDWGLPFFFGNRVFNAIDGKTTTKGTGPYVGW